MREQLFSTRHIYTFMIYVIWSYILHIIRVMVSLSVSYTQHMFESMVLRLMFWTKVILEIGRRKQKKNMMWHCQRQVPELLQFPVLAFWCQKKEGATCKEKLNLISQRMNCVPGWKLKTKINVKWNFIKEEWRKNQYQYML